MSDELDDYGGSRDDERGMPSWARSTASERERMRSYHLANADDAPVAVPTGATETRHRRVGPDYTGAPGLVAIVQGQVYLVAAILILQLFLITVGLFELLSGRSGILWWIAAASLVSFLVALLITLWPRRRVIGTGRERWDG